MLNYRKSIQSGIVYLNPFTDFKPFKGKVEIRWDPLTNLTSRLVHFPARKITGFSFGELVRSSLTSKCPFCEENIDAMTSRFDKSTFGYERFERDGVVVIPNILPFDKYCVVAIVSKEHFVDMNMLITDRYISRGIRVVLDVLRTIKGFDPEARYFSINCNYMPMSGSSILHPHIQAIAGEHPTNYHGLLLGGSEAFYAEHKSSYWETLMEEERELDERFIGFDGRTFWYAPFAPKGNIDLGCIMSKNSIFDLDDDDFSSFETGLGIMLEYLKREQVYGFNFSLFSGLSGEDHFRSNMRIVARRFLPPLKAADTNYFDKIHMENACLFFPENVAQDAKAVWVEQRMKDPVGNA